MSFTTYTSPIGTIYLAADEIGLTHLFFDGDKYFNDNLNCASENPAVTDLAKEWLDIYFSGRKPNFIPSLHLTGTPFQISVYEALIKIPYGTTTTYGTIAKTLNTSARAVGGANAHNPIAIIVPCHRVIGANGSLTGYSGGLDKKIKLLQREGISKEARQ